MTKIPAHPNSAPMPAATPGPATSIRTNRGSVTAATAIAATGTSANNHLLLGIGQRSLENRESCACVPIV
jgi:hypothetical protein